MAMPSIGAAVRQAVYGWIYARTGLVGLWRALGDGTPDLALSELVVISRAVGCRLEINLVA